MSSPTSRTLERLRKMGGTAQVVEKWIPQTRIRQDLFGVIDIVAVGLGGILGVQATSGTGGNASARVNKSLSEPRLKLWLAAGGRFEVWAWAKLGPRGKMKRWKARRLEITLDGDDLIVGEWDEPL